MNHLGEIVFVLFMLAVVGLLIYLYIDAKRDQREFDRIMQEMDKHQQMMQDYLVALGVEVELRRKIDGSRIPNTSGGGADGEATAPERKDTHSF